MSGKRSRDKGARREREAVALLRGIGVQAQRVPLSGAVGAMPAGGDEELSVQFRDDLLCQVDGWLFRVEVKARANAQGWQTINAWLGASDALMLMQDRSEPKLVLPWRSFVTLVDRIKGADDGGFPVI